MENVKNCVSYQNNGYCYFDCKPLHCNECDHSLTRDEIDKVPRRYMKEQLDMQKMRLIDKAYKWLENAHISGDEYSFCIDRFRYYMENE